jgi:alkylation response protein AidB-like acyl-CoA dehydrogenase
VPLRRENRPPLPPGVALPADSDPHSSFNGIRVHRLKNKLGTKFVPTAELELNGAVGELVGEPGRGVALIAGGECAEPHL